MKATSLPVSLRYTLENVSSLYSRLVASFESSEQRTSLLLSWEHKVLQDGVVHPGESAATGPRLLSTAVAGRLAEDATLANEHDVVIRELLLEFTCEPVWC